MPKKRVYTFSNPCRDCETPVTATFLIPDKYAVLVANELKRNGAILCKDCGLKAREKADDKPTPEDAPTSKETSRTEAEPRSEEVQEKPAP